MEIGNRKSDSSPSDIEPSPVFISGCFRINPRSYTDAFVTDPNGGADIYIEGINSRGPAMDSDIVKVRLNHHSKWKLNYNMIAVRWDEWSKHLSPIISQIDSAEAQARKHSQSVQTGVESIHNKQIKSRVKRHVKNANDLDEIAKKIPSNLPSGISKLRVEHIVDLPFSAQCLQKTATVVDVIKRNHQGIAGGFLRTYSNSHALFSPTDSRVPRMLIAIQECPLDFASEPSRYKNVLFVAQMMDWEGTSKIAIGTLLKIIGDSNQMQSRMEALLMEHQIYDQDFPPEAYQELDYLNHLPDNYYAENSVSRKDLTNECIFTIDPKTARDLDDAVSIKQVAEQIYEVGVHIADVTHFVKEMTMVDHQARLRTTSVYLVDRVIPMLPRILCEKVCSLNPGEPKLAFSVIWKMNKYGKIIDQWAGRTIIKSCVKLAYEEAQCIIDKPNSTDWIQEGVNMPKLHSYNWTQISKSVVVLNRIARNLRLKRFQDGALRIDQVKMKYELDRETGYPTGYTIEQRGEANFLIEEFMLLANMSVAKIIHAHCKELAFMRRHPSSSSQLLKEVKEFCDAKGYPLDITSSGSLQKSLNAISDPLTSKVVSFLLLRAMKNAEYVCAGSLPVSDSSIHHFALNAPFYTHFTSPIRRYADVIVHRLLGLALDYHPESLESTESLSEMADECNRRKLSSKLISDTSQKLYFNLFVQKAGFCELLGCVTRIYDKSFDVILIDYDRTGRVYLDPLKPNLESYKFESFSGIKRLVLKWQPPPKEEAISKKKKKKRKKHPAKDQSKCHPLEAKQQVYQTDPKLIVKEPVGNEQIIEVFDVVSCIVSTNEKDFTQLVINLKIPNQQQPK